MCPPMVESLYDRAPRVVPADLEIIYLLFLLFFFVNTINITKYEFLLVFRSSVFHTQKIYFFVSFSIKKINKSEKKIVLRSPVFQTLIGPRLKPGGIYKSRTVCQVCQSVCLIKISGLFKTFSKNIHKFFNFQQKCFA